MQKDYSNATDHAITIKPPDNSSTHPTITASPTNVDAAIFGVKVATGIATTLLPTLIYLAYTDNLPYATWFLPIAASQTVMAYMGYIYCKYYNRKATDKQTQHFVQAMKMKQRVQPGENEECPICLEPGNSNQPIYSLPDCPCSSHYFHIDCITTHIEVTPLRILKCPVCRVKMDINVDIKSLTKRHAAA